jgi:hypothetical protein
VREQTSVTATLNQAKAGINTALQDMHIGYGERFPVGGAQGRITTQTPYTTGTVAITQGQFDADRHRARPGTPTMPSA